MQSQNGDVELSVTLDTKGIKKDADKIKDIIEKEMSAGTSLSSLSREADEAAKNIKTLVIDSSSMLNMMRTALNAASGGFGVLSASAKIALYNIMANVDTASDKIRQELVDAGVSPDFLKDWQTALENLKLEISKNTLEENLQEVNPIISPEISIEPESAQQALDETRPRLHITDAAIEPAVVDEALLETNPSITIKDVQLGPEVVSDLETQLSDVAVGISQVNVGQSQTKPQVSEQVKEDIRRAVQKCIEAQNPVEVEVPVEAVPEVENVSYYEPVDREKILKELQEVMHPTTEVDDEAKANMWDNVVLGIEMAENKLIAYHKELSDTKEVAKQLAVDLQMFNQGFQYSEEFKSANADLEFLKSELSSVTKQLDRMRILGENTEDSQKYQDLIEKASILVDTYGEINEELQEMREDKSAYSVGVNPTELAQVERMYDTLIDKTVLLNTKTEQFKSLTGSDLLNALTYSFNNTKKRISSIVKFIGNAVKSIGRGLVGLIKPLKNIHKQAGSTFNFKNILKYALGIGSLMALFNKLRSAITQGMQNLARWRDGNNQTNKNISMLMTSLLQLKNALATAFDPILNVITPALNKMIELLIEASNALSQFFAKITGQSFWMKAIRVQQDYAKSLKGTTGAAKGALAAFDDLDVLNKNGGADASQDPNNMFEQMPIDTISDMVDDWVTKIKLAWETADFTDIGNILGEWLKKMLDNIPWEEIKEWARKVAHSIATLLNGFIETEGLAFTIGKTIAEAINTAFEFANEFIKTFHWDSLGKFIGEALLGIVNWLDAELIGETIGGDIRAAITVAFNAVQTFIEGDGFRTVGRKIGTALRVAIEQMLAIDEQTGMNGFQEAGSTIANLINGLFIMLDNALREVPWTDLASGLASGLNEMIKGLHAEDIGTTIHTILQTAFDFVSTLLSDTDMDLLVDKIGELFKNINLDDFLDDVAGVFFKLVSLALNTVGEMIKSNPKIAGILFSALLTMGIVDVGVKLGGTIASSMLKAWAEKMVANGALESVLKTAGSVGLKIGGAVIGGYIAAVEGFKFGKYLGAHIWEEDKQEYDDFNWNKFWEAFLGPAETSLKEKITYMFEHCGEIMTGVLTTVLHANLGPFTVLIEGAINSWLKALSMIFPALADVELNIGDMFFNIITDAKDFVKDILHAMVDLVTGSEPILTRLKNFYIGIFNAIKDGIKEPINGILGLVEKLINKIIRGFNSLVRKLNKFKIEVPDNPLTGKQTIGFNLNELDTISIPRLAQGAVIPPNKEFLAMLGDQRYGTNIEAPLDTIKQAFADVVGNLQVQNTGSAVMQLDGQTFARLVTPYVVSELNRQGYNVSVLEA